MLVPPLRAHQPGQCGQGTLLPDLSQALLKPRSDVPGEASGLEGESGARRHAVQRLASLAAVFRVCGLGPAGVTPGWRVQVCRSWAGPLRLKSPGEAGQGVLLFPVMGTLWGCPAGGCLQSC